MKGITHILAGILIGVIIPSDYKVLSFSLAFIGAIIPDIDTFSIVSNNIFRIPLLHHRGFTHSLWIPILLIILSGYYPDINFLIFPFILGLVSHTFLDCLTPSGVLIFYPLKFFHPRGNFRSGGIKEMFLRVILIILIVISLLVGW